MADKATPKAQIEDLAIFGGSSAFQTELHVGRPNIGNREQLFKRIDEILDRRWLTNDGPCVREFEDRIASLVGVKHCIVVCNATVGLEILLKALALAGEVILPSFTFVSTAHALQWVGIRPVFCDVDPATHNLDPERAKELINERTSAILGVHVWGRPCAIEALSELARRHQVNLLFDAAHGLACSHKGKMIGGFGDAEVFSFHATKFVNTFEGGAIATNNDELANQLRLMRNFGFAGLDHVASIGMNAKMNEVSAAMGLTSLDGLPDFIETNRVNYERYRKQLSGMPGICLLPYDQTEKCNYQYIVLEIDEAKAGVSRDVLDRILWAEKILSRRYFYPGCHRMEPYRSNDRSAALRLPETERIAKRVLCLPNGSAVGADEIGTICALIGFIIKNSAAILDQLSTEPTLSMA